MKKMLFIFIVIFLLNGCSNNIYKESVIKTNISNDIFDLCKTMDNSYLSCINCNEDRYTLCEFHYYPLALESACECMG